MTGVVRLSGPRLGQEEAPAPSERRRGFALLVALAGGAAAFGTIAWATSRPETTRGATFDTRRRR